MRCFVAVDLTEELRPKIIELQEQLPDDVKIVEPENLHFTLKFLGEVSDEVLAEVSSRLRAVASQFTPFDARIHGAGVFPSIDYVRVIWLGCTDLFNLQTAVENALAPLFKKEKPAPHLTIARVRSAVHRNGIKDFINRNKAIEIGKMRVSAIKLKKSILTKQGPIYEDVKTFDLA